MGVVVADKNCEKIHQLSEGIYACGAGTAVSIGILKGLRRPFFGLCQIPSKLYCYKLGCSTGDTLWLTFTGIYPSTDSTGQACAGDGEEEKV